MTLDEQIEERATAIAKAIADTSPAHRQALLYKVADALSDYTIHFTAGQFERIATEHLHGRFSYA